MILHVSFDFLGITAPQVFGSFSSKDFLNFIYNRRLCI